MALRVDDQSVVMRFRARGARAAVHAGREFAVVHCSAGANLGAGDRVPGGRVKTNDAIEIEGSVFVEATGNEFELGEHEFGMAQVTEIQDYQLLYVGRMASEGSVLLNLGAGFTNNPSLDVQPRDGESIDEHIFSYENLSVRRVTQPRPGLQVGVTFGDHPNNLVPWKFENRITRASNHLARIRRFQHFVVYFLTRENAAARPRILGRLGWAVTWDCEVNWSVARRTPMLKLDQSHLFPGEFRIGAPAAGDPWARIAVERLGPATNVQDERTVDLIYGRGTPPTCVASASPPNGFRSDFFR